MLFYPKNIAFGLDIGDKSIKIAEIKLIKNLRGESFLILSKIDEMTIPQGLIMNGEIKNPPAVVALIAKISKKMRGAYLSTKAVVASLPETQCYIKTLTVPQNIKLEEMPYFIEQNIAKHFPLTAEQSYFDFNFIDETDVLVGVAPKNIVDSYTSVIEQAGLIPLSLEIEGIAIARALTPDKFSASDSKTKILMDLGATRSSIIAVANQAVLITLNIPLSGDEMTQEISKAEKISFDEAEKIKIACGLDQEKCSLKTKKVIIATIKSAAEQIKTGLKFINSFLVSKTDKIYISGGVAAAPKITGLLSEKLNLKIRHADPIINIKLKKGLNLVADDLLKYTTAIGLSMRGTEADLLNIGRKIK
jgi:type IV pilus assembly protein PilM